MPNSLIFPIVSFLLLLCTGCDNKIVKGATPLEVFDAFWKIMDERYVYFPERNIDWDSVYHANYSKVKSFRSEEELKPVLQEIINFVGDRHLYIVCQNRFNIKIAEDTMLPAYKTPWRKYGFDDYWKAGRHYYAQFGYEVDAWPHEKGIVYLQNRSFLSLQNDTAILSVLKKLDYSKGIILDIRTNAGGYSESCYKTAALFYQGNRMLHYDYRKTGPGHSDFSEKYPYYYQGTGQIPSTIPIILLVSPKTYSGGNLLAFILQDLSNVVLVGEPTGGGGSGVAHLYLPNGWIINYPFCPSYGVNGQNMEFGIAPDIYVPLTKADTCDYQILKALEILIQNN